jgi:regulator of chromosome condensation
VPSAAYNGPLQVIADTCTATPCTSFLTGVDAIVSTNSLATLALRSGQIYGWGRNLNGLLGLPSGTPSQVPYPRLVPASVAMTAISASNIHALAIGPGNAVYAWGSGLRGALGDGVGGNTRTSPQLVTLP